MPLSLTCRHCGIDIVANDEDDLVTRVQVHAQEHDPGRVLTREHILARLRHVQRGRQP